MATKMPVFEESFTAGADLSTHQWKGVMLTGAGTVGLQGAAGVCLGVLQNKPKQGEAACVMHIGRSPVYADGSGTAIAVGDLVRPNASGVFIKATAGETNIVGVAQEACTIAGGIISITLDYF
jgi:hypothetical protein